MDIASPVAAPVSTRTKYKRINYALAATLIATGVSYDEAAAKVGAKNANVLRVGLFKKGVSVAQINKLPVSATRHTTISAALVTQTATEASKLLKDKMSDVLQHHTEALSMVKARIDLKHITRVGQALEPLARTAKIVHGWGDESVSGLISIGVVEQLQRPGCGVDTPTGSAQELNQNTQAPQLSEVIDVESSAS